MVSLLLLILLTPLLLRFLPEALRSLVLRPYALSLASAWPCNDTDDDVEYMSFIHVYISIHLHMYLHTAPKNRTKLQPLRVYVLFTVFSILGAFLFYEVIALPSTVQRGAFDRRKRACVFDLALLR